MTKDIRDRLTGYLSDAHAIEEQSLAQLRRAPEIAGEPELARTLEEHVHETEGHERRIRRLLHERGAEPSSVKEPVMRAGGAAFVLFARSQTDTPGKLASHALSYEALEWASYDLLALTAEHAHEPAVASVARSIREEERAMMRRIESLLDRTTEASLKEGPDAPLDERLRKYLADAHALEAQALQLLESGTSMVDEPSLTAVFEAHVADTRRHLEIVESQLSALDGDPSTLQDAAMRLGGLTWSTFFRMHPDTQGKLAAFAYAFEHLEIGGYEQLRRVAERARRADVVQAAERILEDERRTAERLAATFPDVVVAVTSE